MKSKTLILLSVGFFIFTSAVLLSIYLLEGRKQYSVQTLELGAQPLGSIQDFELKDQNNNVVSLKNLMGKVWVADFMFTTCSGICPMLTNHMARLNKIFANVPDVLLVSISVNPENDSPEILKSYAQKFNADPKRWLFLTGPRDTIQKLAAQSFKIGSMEEPVFHSAYFTLVDRLGRIRGYYEGTEEQDIKQLTNDLKRLLKE